jgi:hypothetical protein
VRRRPLTAPILSLKLIKHLVYSSTKASMP